MGITGTKGKSTTSFLLKSIFAAAGMHPSIIGSIETDDGIDAFESHNTTPEAVDLWRHVFNTAESGRKHLVMEVSSHALKYDRTLGLMLDVACFLNIGRDHISPSEHPSFEDYFASKLRIFDQCSPAEIRARMKMPAAEDEHCAVILDEDARAVFGFLHEVRRDDDRRAPL